MKKSTLIALFVAAILLIGGHQKGWSQVLVENFDYTIGSLLTANGWTAHSGAGTLPIDVTTGLSFSGYAGSGIGGAANVDNNGEDVNKTFTTPITSGPTYAAFIIQTQATNSVGYFLNLGQSAIGTTFISRVWVNATGTGVGIGGSTPASYVTITPGVPTLLVVKYDWTSKVSSLYVFTTFPSSEPTTADATFTETTTVTNVGSIALRQYSASQRIIVDGIRVAATWADAVTPPAGVQVETPTFTPPSGNYYSAQSVSIASATVGATIHYTIDGTDPDETSAVYSTPLSVSTTTTIKAKAYLTGMSPSGIASSLYRFPIVVNSIAALRAGLTDGTTYTLSSEAIVTYQRPDNQRNQMYIKDATAAIVVDDLALVVTNDFNIGDGVTGLTGTLSLFNSLLEFVPTVNPGTASSTGNDVTPEPRTLASLTSADQAKLVSIPFVSFSTPGNFVASINYPITDASGTGTFRTLFGEADYLVTPTPIPTTPQNMVALVGQAGAVIQVTSRFLEDMTPATPSWTSGWPKAENPSQTVFNAKVNLDVPGTAYFVVLPSGAAAPTAQQVKDGQDASGAAVASNLAGNIVCAAGATEYISGVTGLTPATTYNVFFVAEASGNLQASPVMKVVATTLGGTAPVIISPTATAITNTTADLGGNITSDGGNTLTERGTVWSLTSPVTIADHKLAAGGTATGTFSHSRTGMPVATQIFYAAYATNGIGTSLSSEASFYTVATEPTDHVTAFATGTTSTTSIQLNWTVAAGAVPPTGYLIKASDVSYAAIVDPVDGVAEANSALVQNVAQGVETYTFTGLAIGGTYYFKIYPYTGTTVTTNFKTSPAAPQASATTNSAGVYIWNGGNGSFIVTTNWTPERTTPAVNDILQFSDGGTDTITNVPAQTIGQLKLSNNTKITFTATAANTFVIAGLASGTDLVIPAGCAFNLYGSGATMYPIVVSLSSGATAVIDGSITFAGTALISHRLLAATAGAVTFNPGSFFKAGAFFNGNAFGGTTAPLGTANTVIFTSGSTYIHQAGSNPFALSQPASAVVFNAGSLYKFIGAITPAFSGRTYADIEFDLIGGTFTPVGTAAVSMNNLTITNGTLNFNVTGTPGHSIKGNIYVAPGGTLNFNPGSVGTVNFNGTSAQSISGAGLVSTNANSTLSVVNPLGVTLNANVTLNGTLTLSGGLLTLGTGNLTFGASTGSLSGIPSATNMIVATGTGEVRKLFTAAGTFTFPVGDNTGTAEYSPVTLNFTTGTFTAPAYAGVKLANSAYPGVSGNYINRYWDVTSSGISAYACDATFNYLPADVVGTEASMVCALMSPYTTFAAANTTTHQLTAAATTTLGSFTGKDPVSATKALSVKLFIEGLYAGGGLLNQAADENGPHFPAGVADQVTLELRDGTTGAVVYTMANLDLSTSGMVTTTVPASYGASYYIYVKHRNSVTTSTATAVLFAGASISYDFTTSAAQAFGGNQQNLGGAFCFYSGDENQDLLVDSSDMIDADNMAAAFGVGYIPTDINGDGLIDSSDMILVDNNATAFIAAILPF